MTAPIHTNITTIPGLTAYQACSGILGARTIVIDDVGDILVLARGESAVYACYPEAHSSTGYNEVKILNAPAELLTHGLAYKDEWIYATSPDAVYRWPYTAGARAPITAAYQVVVIGVPFETTTLPQSRSILFGPDGFMYLQIGTEESNYLPKYVSLSHECLGVYLCVTSKRVRPCLLHYQFTRIASDTIAIRLWIA